MIWVQNKFWRIVIWLFIFGTVCLAVFTVGRILITFRLHDFDIYYRGVGDLLAHTNPYANRPGEVIYPPVALLLLMPLGFFSQTLAEDVWTVISVISILGSLAMLLILWKGKIKAKHIGLSFGLAMLSFPVKWNLGMGQINLLLLLLVIGSFYAYRKSRSITSGVLLGIASAIKFIPLPLFLFFLHKRQRRSVVAGGLMFLFMQLAGGLVVGKEINFYYWSQVFPHLPTVGNIAYYNQALTGFLARAHVSVEISKLINYSVFVGLLIGVWKVTDSNREKLEKELLEYGLLVLAVLIGAGLAWQYYFVLTVIPFAGVFLLIINSFNKLKWYCVFTLIAYLLISGNIKHPENFGGVKVVFLSHVLYGTMLLYGIAFSLLRRRSTWT